ncbi:adaptor protein MecA [Dorea longicatena]|uniref:adaptor protein MecA n=1 Tax=Dorea longicatena TaxID=88431 RepID=UPI003F8A7158
MKIEKISDNQIRCTLTRADLADRQLQLSELAYGTEKAKSLFRDMMQQAAFEFGFEAEDIPLMIEAIPSADSIVLIITKVEDPEELDTRFSKFAPSSIADAKKKNTPGKLEGAEGLLDLLGKVQESFEAQAAQTPKAASETSDNADKKDSGNNIRLFSFPVMENVLKAAHLLAPMYHGSNTLYKDDQEEMYLLALAQSDHSTADFNRICNMLSEYGALESASGATFAFLEEHCETFLSGNAVQQLANI